MKRNNKPKDYKNTIQSMKSFSIPSLLRGCKFFFVVFMVLYCWSFVLVSIDFRHIKIQRLGIFTLLGHIWGNACRLGIKSAVYFSTKKKKSAVCF